MFKYDKMKMKKMNEPQEAQSRAMGLREIIGNKREIKLISATVWKLAKLGLSILSKSKSTDVRYSSEILCKSQFYPPDLQQDCLQPTFKV